MIKNSKNNSFLTIWLLACLSLGASCLIGHYVAHEPQSSAQTPAPQENSLKTPEQFQRLVDTLMTNTWEQIQSTTGISFINCQDYAQEHYSSFHAEIQQDNAQQTELLGPVSDQTTTLIHAIMDDCGIDKNLIQIVAIEGGRCPAGANDFTFYVDEKVLASFPEAAQYFIIAHELSHIKNKDISIETALTAMLDPKNESHNNCLEAFETFTEVRADILALLMSSKYAQGGITFFEEYLKRYGDHKRPSHPLPSERIKIAQDVYAMHKNLQKEPQSIDFNDQLSNLTTQTWNLIETGTGVTIQDCNALLTDNAEYFKEGAYAYRESIASPDITLAPETISLIHTVCKDFNVDPNNIDLLCYKGKGSPACADDYAIYINSTFFNSLSTEAQQFVVAHELTHFKNKDNSMENALASLTDPDNNAHTACRESYTHFIELRADITAMLKGSQYCKGGISFFKELMSRYGDKASNTHPKPSDRLKMAYDILNTQQVKLT